MYVAHKGPEGSSSPLHLAQILDKGGDVLSEPCIVRRLRRRLYLIRRVGKLRSS